MEKTNIKQGEFLERSSNLAWWNYPSTKSRTEKTERCTERERGEKRDDDDLYQLYEERREANIHVRVNHHVTNTFASR